MLKKLSLVLLVLLILLAYRLLFGDANLLQLARLKKTLAAQNAELAILRDRNKDIAQEIGKIKNNKILVGFAAETNDLIENASLKIKKKNLDFIVANDLTKEGAGFGVDTNIVKIIDKEGNITEYPKMKKEEVANVLTRGVLSS